MSIYNEPPPGMCIVPDKEDITKVCGGPSVHLTPAVYSSLLFIKQWFLFIIFDKNLSD